MSAAKWVALLRLYRRAARNVGPIRVSKLEYSALLELLDSEPSVFELPGWDLPC